MTDGDSAFGTQMTLAAAAARVAAPMPARPLTADDVAPIAEEAETLLRRLEIALPLRSEHARSTALGLARYCRATGREPDGLSLGELFHLASATTDGPSASAAAWFAVGKVDGAWFALGRAHALNPCPLILIDRGRRRRLLEATAFVDAQPFHTEAEARAAGRTVFPRTYVSHFSRPPA